MKRPKTQTTPTDLERMHYTDESGRKRIATIRPLKSNSVKMLLGYEILSYQKFTRDGTPTNEFGIICVEMITKRVPLVQDLTYATLEVAKS